MSTYKLSKHLHKPALVIALELPELCMFFMAHGVALVAGGFWWFVMIVPFFVISWLRKRPRGFLTHGLCVCGLSKINGYPPIITREFHQ
jgi:hypothetical protein